MRKMTKEEKLNVDKSELLATLVDDYLIASGHTKEELALKLGFHRATFYTRIKNIGKFRVSELVELCKILGVDDATRAMLLAY